MDELIKKALSATQEADDIEFKSAFDVKSKKDWINVVKDIVALANSAGGAIVFGVDDYGIPSNFDTTEILKYDPAKITDKIYQYTGVHFSKFVCHESQKGYNNLALLVIKPADFPMIFIKPGSYPDPNSKRGQLTEFSQGTIYFRHGAKSETGVQNDIRQAIDNRVEKLRSGWLSNIKKVMYAPEGAKVTMVPYEVKQSSSPDAIPFRWVDDPDAQEFRVVDSNETHIYRQREFLEVLNKKLQERLGRSINFYDLMAISKVYDTKENKRFYFKPKSGSAQYSNGFVEWILQMFNENKSFFSFTRNQYISKLKNERLEDIDAA